MALSQIECYLPKYSISNDNMDALTITNSGDDSEEEHLIEEVIEILSMFDEDKKLEQFDHIFITEGYQKIAKYKEQIRKRFSAMIDSLMEFDIEIRKAADMLYLSFGGEKKLILKFWNVLQNCLK